MPVYTEVLPATKSSPHSAIRWTPADPDATPAPGDLPAAGTLFIDTRRATTAYKVVEVPCGGAFDGRAFRLDKPENEPGTDPEESFYHTFIGRNRVNRLCECKGFGRTGHCKHCDAVEALLLNGWV